MHRSPFYKFFPVPKYLEMPAVGMDISEVSLRFVELVPKGDGFILGKYGERPIPQGAIATGDIKKMDVFEDVLRKARKDFSIGFVRASLSEAHAYLADFETPRVPKRDLRNSIELQMEEHVPLPANDIFFDYINLEKEKKKQAENFHIIVSAVPKTPVLQYIEAFAAAGITLLSVEVDADALVRAILSPKDVGTIMIIEMGRVKTGIYIVVDRVVRFVSELDIGAKTVASMLEKNLNISAEEANEMIKNAYGDEAPQREVSEILSVFYSRMKEEVERHYIYWNTHHDLDLSRPEKIERIVLAGSQSSLAGMAEFLSSAFQEPVSHANPWANVSPFQDYIPEINRNDSLRYATAIGLALHPYERFLV